MQVSQSVCVKSQLNKNNIMKIDYRHKKLGSNKIQFVLSFYSRTEASFTPLFLNMQRPLFVFTFLVTTKELIFFGDFTLCKWVSEKVCSEYKMLSISSLP